MSFTGHKTEENFSKYICVSKKEYANIAQSYFKDMWADKVTSLDRIQGATIGCRQAGDR